MSPATLTFPKIDTDLVQFVGGLDQVTPTLHLKPGVPHEALNMECNVLGGFSRIGGYERFDGRTKPSTSTYSIVQVEAMLVTPVVGQILTGNTTATLSGGNSAASAAVVVITPPAPVDAIVRFCAKSGCPALTS